jgi:hypothetical protein
MKFLSNKHLNKLGKSTLAMVLAGSVVFSAPLAFAAEETTEGDTYKTVDLGSVTSTDENIAVEQEADVVENTEDSVTGVSEERSTDAEGTEVATEETATPDEKMDNGDIEAPSLVPGDLFYFVKIALEKIRLAITIDDVKDAELLATYAAERLAEANVLFAEGNEAEALKVIEKALENLEGTEAVVNEVTQAEDVETNKEAEDQNTNKDGTETEKNEAVEDSTEVSAVNTTEDTVGTAEVEELVSQNIIALTAAMEKVKNPTAKAALQKNIDKSYKKLAKKIAKLEEKQARKAKMTEDAPVEAEGTVDEQTAENTVTTENTATTEPAAQTEDTATAIETTEVQTPAAPAASTSTPASEVKAPAKPERAEANAAAKVVKQEAKQEVKEIHNEVKQEAKRIKTEAKAEKAAVKENGNQQKSEGKGQDKE